MTVRSSVVVLPSAHEATIVISQRPLASSNGALNVPSAPTVSVTGCGASAAWSAASATCRVWASAGPVGGGPR